MFLEVSCTKLLTDYERESMNGACFVYHNIGVPVFINISDLMFILYALFHV
jgi:hypothetical protein